MKLILVGLPLGNIEDISLRAIETLKKVRVVVCEDTRVFNKLWMKLCEMGMVEDKFAGRLMVVNDFNEKMKVQEVMDALKTEDVVLVSDAGMPGISDPGFVLVKAALTMGAEVTTVPGPTAAMSAVAVSGLSTDRILFLGFLPKKTAKRNKVWEMVSEGMTVVVYESPYRVEKTLKEIKDKFGDVEVVVARELTKQHEQILRGQTSFVLGALPNTIKGEVVLMFRV